MNDLVPGLTVAALAALGACALLSWWFVLRYSRVRWRETAEGRHLMRFTRILALTFTATLVLNLAPVPPIAAVALSTVLFSAIAAELWTRINLLHHAQHPHE